jgi:tetrapyrrole methylase family protein/MazG family protein
MENLLPYVTATEITPFERLVRLMEVLRSENGCAWDRAQSHKSLLPYLVEESYEVIEAIEEGRFDELPEELGDLQLQILFHAQIARERGAFEIDDALTLTLNKMIARHPHVFGEKKELNPQQVRDQWEQIKTKSGEKKSVLGGVPKHLPALTMAFRIGEKAGGRGFDWETPEQVFDKITEEIGEVKAELNADQPRDKERLSAEIGDLLFAVASLSRKLGIEPETALRGALVKFRDRFDKLERRVNADRGEFEQYSLAELELIWQAIKRD